MTDTEALASFERTGRPDLRDVYQALRSDGVRGDVAYAAVATIPSWLSDQWQGLYVEIDAARVRAIRLDDDRRHARRPIYYRCVMPLCRHCGVR